MAIKKVADRAKKAPQTRKRSDVKRSTVKRAKTETTGPKKGGERAKETAAKDLKESKKAANEDRAEIGKEVKEAKPDKPGENGQDNKRVSDLTTRLNEALGRIEELEKQDEAKPEEAAAAKPEEPAEAPAPAEAAAPAEAPAAPAAAEGPKLSPDQELKALLGEVMMAQQMGQNPAQAKQQLQTKYQEFGGDQSREISPQTKQSVKMALGQGAAMGQGAPFGSAQGFNGVMNALDALLGPTPGAQGTPRGMAFSSR